MNSSVKNFLFQNTGLKQTIAKNTFWLTLAEIIVKCFSLVLVVYMARVLGATEYGKFVFALSFVSVTAILSDLGVIDIATREFSRDKENEKKFASIFTLEFTLYLLAAVVTIVSSFFITQDGVIRSMIWVLIVFVLNSSLFGITFSFLRARQRMEYEAIVRIVQSAFHTLTVFLIIFLMPSALNISYGYLFSDLIALSVLLLIFHKYAHRVSLRFSKGMFALLKTSWPLSFGFMPGWIYISINSIVLGSLGLITENGWYGAASKIAIAAIVPASLIIKSFYPVLSNFFISSKEQLQKAWDYFAQSMIFLAIPIVVGGVVLAPKIIYSFYGREFMPSVLAFELLVLVIGISFINYPYTMILVVADKQKNTFLLMAIGAALNIVLDFIFIPRYGFYASIAATIISCLVVLLLTVILSWRHKVIHVFNKKLFSAAFISLFSSAAMYFVVTLKPIYDLNVVLVSVIGFLTYIGVLFFFYRIIFHKTLLNF